MPPRRRITAYEKRIVGARGGWRCAECGQLLDEAWEADHVVPLHLGGEDSVDNLQSLCLRHHREKTLREDIARVRARRNAGRTPSTRPPLVCTRCDHIVSPYFAHTCDKGKK
jgi:hypothetical protein